MPMPLSAFPTFEKRNSCSINVYQLEKSKLVSVYHSKNRKGRHKIDLLRLLENRNSHYCLIKIISNLIHFLCHSNQSKTKGQNHDSAETASNRQLNRTSTNMHFFARATPHWRFECLSGRHLSSLLVGKNRRNVLLLYMLISKQSVLRRHRFRE